MYKKTIYLSFVLLLFSLMACQRDSSSKEDIATIQPDVPKSQLTASTNEEAAIDDDKLQQEKEEKLARLQELKDKKEAFELQKQKELEEKEAAAKMKRAKARAKKKAAEREAKRVEEEKTLLVTNTNSADVEGENQDYEEAEPTEPQGKLQFIKRSYDFGKIQEGDTFKHEFKFYNSSQVPVVISDVKASCGCTETTFPKEPILPGETGVIGVTFDSKGKLGRQKPFMSVVTNGNPSIYSLYMDGTVDTERE